MLRTPPSRRPRRAFTLVELLVVITIIGILAGLITAAAIRARVTAKNAVIKSEISQLAMAIEAYKTKYGEYPPDLTDTTALNRHLRKAFPRYTGDAAQFLTDVKTAYGVTDTSEIGPASALVIFLGGVPENPNSTKPAGFHADPSNPFRTGSPRTQPFFDFDPGRLEVANGVKLHCYYRPRDVTNGAPYVYFKSRRQYLHVKNNTNVGGMYDEYGYVDTNENFLALSFKYGNDYCVPYLASANTVLANASIPVVASNNSYVNPREWRDAGKFQIVAPGLDGLFGNAWDSSLGTSFRVSQSGEGFSDNGGDFDNLTSFSQGTLEDEMNQ